MASSAPTTPRRSRELPFLDTNGAATTNPNSAPAHSASTELPAHTYGASLTPSGVARSPLSRASKMPVHAIRSTGTASLRSALTQLSPQRKQLPAATSSVHPSTELSPLHARARCTSSTLLQNYILRRNLHIFTRQAMSAADGKKARDHGQSRIASADEQAFYAGEREKIARRLDECTREIAALEPIVEETYLNIGANQKALHSALEEQQRLEAIVRDLSQRELACLEERARIEDEYFSRLSAGLPFWPAEVRTAARHFVHCVQRTQHRSDKEDHDGDTHALQAFTQWLTQMGIRGPRRGIIPGEHCMTEEKIIAMRTAFLGRG